MTSPLPARSLDDLDPADRKRLEGAHRRLREAVKAYEPFLGGRLEPDQPVPAHHEAAMWRAQEDVEAAEQELWRLNEELLGWSRPAWAPPATLVADWFSDEDRIYDEPPYSPED